MSNINKEHFIRILKIVRDEGLVSQLQNSGSVLRFFSSIWNLRSMPPVDDRFSNLYDDIKRHWVENISDFDDDELFFDRLKILDDPEKYIPFIEAAVNPDYIDDEGFRNNIRHIVNQELRKDNLELALSLYENGKPIFKVMESIQDIDACDIVRNTIPFIVEKQPVGYSHHWSSHTTPAEFPSFILVSDDGWDDAGAHTQFNLFYYASSTLRFSFGLVKIIRLDCKFPSVASSGYYVKNDGLPDHFFNLPKEFCSLGQDLDYYKEIKKVFPENYRSILLALRDVAVFTQFDDSAKASDLYGSLVRDNRAERNIREVNLYLSGRDIDNRYTFTYHFQPPFALNMVDFHFGFRKPEQTVSRRIYAIIGKNGVGKTLFISSLPRDLASASQEHFYPAKPILSKVISLSDSNFDNFQPAANNGRLNYKHFGMVRFTSEGCIPKTREELSKELLAAYSKIEYLGRTAHLKHLLSSLINKEILEQLIVKRAGRINTFAFNKDSLRHLLSIMSSGESIMYYMFCMLEAEMRYDSLILMDEPETHLHPNAISELVCALDEILQEYESCCIMVTHSPMLVRELSSDCVYIMERDGDLSIVRKPSIETLGGNLSTIVDDIFGSREVQRNYKRRISEISKRLPKQKLIELVKSEQLPLGVGIELFINSLYPDEEAQ